MDSDSEPETRSERAYQAQLYFNLGYRQQMEQRLELAIDFYRKSIAVLATAEAHTYLGWAYSFAGRLDDAIEECLLAIAVDPDFGNPYNDIGSYMMAKGDLDGAIPWLQKALLAPRYESYCFPHFNLGRVYEERGGGLDPGSHGGHGMQVGIDPTGALILERQDGTRVRVVSGPVRPA